MSHPTPPTKTRLTREEFIAFQALPENAEKWFEFIDGEIYDVTPPSHRHSRIVSLLFKLLVNFADTHQLGEVFGDGTGYELPNGSTLMPDVSFVSLDRMPPIDSPLELAPDLAVEVISPSNTFAEMRRKIELYLSNGSSRVWMIYPDERVVEIYQTLSDGRFAALRLHEGDTLNDADFLPNFSVRVSELFPKG